MKTMDIQGIWQKSRHLTEITTSNDG